MRNKETRQSDREEADNCMFIYARYLVTNNQIGRIIIASPGTDALIVACSTLLNHFFHTRICDSKQEIPAIYVTLLSVIYVKNMVLSSANQLSMH